ncbi:MAG: PHP domain-containing protein [Lachnospiraceae bacterium]|nr:PHP domain-containing protein [Lachnospiraceae bacterium]
MKLDMHCHTKEGSLDGKIPIAQYIALLQKNGIDGMLVSDHNSYGGYRYWKKHREEMPSDFVVLKGIEYDTIDAGHILVILPAGVKVPLLELRGLPVGVLIDIVHRHGGILGPAHPCGERFLSLTNNRRFRRQKSVLERFDFVETFNSCEPEESNMGARLLADAYGKPGFGGSDSHRPDCVGTAYTCFSADIQNEDDLIDYVCSGSPTTTGGYYYHGTTREKMGKMNCLLVFSFWFYNKGSGLLRRHRRTAALRADDESALRSYEESRNSHVI